MTAVHATPAVMDKASRRPSTAPSRNERYHRGEIWLIASDPAAPPVGNELWSDRPGVIISNNVLNARSGVAQIVYLSSSARKRSSPTHVPIAAVNGGTGTTMALCEQIHTVDASRLRRRIGSAPESSLRDLDAAIALSLSIGRNPNTTAAFRKWEEHIKLHGIDLATEITALAGQTADRRVESLSRALRLVAAERDAYQQLFESLPARAAALDEVAAALQEEPE